MQNILREPLIHFFTLGLLLFALEQIFLSEDEQTKKIVVGTSVYEDIAEAFEEGRGRRPSPEEMKPLVETWVSNEVLFREAKALQLDQGDEMIRERVTQKIRVIIGDSLDVKQPNEDELRAWFEDHRSNYDLPAFYDFSFWRAPDEAAAKEQVAQWNSAIEEEQLSKPGIRILRFRSRAEQNIQDLLGEEIATELIGQDLHTWSALEGPKGWAALRLDHVKAPEVATFNNVREDVLKRWQTWATQQAGRKRVADMRAEYNVIYKDAPESVYDTSTKAAAASESDAGESR